MKKGRIKIVEDIDPNDPSKKKARKAGVKGWSEKNFDEDSTGDDLDIPGSELDDKMEEVGSEDEENNFYSLGGDRHHNLDEHE